MSSYVIIVPRVGVSASEVREWLLENFQRRLTFDAGPGEPQTIRLFGGNPIVNAEIVVAAGIRGVLGEER